jgi:hypothetical protein
MPRAAAEIRSVVGLAHRLPPEPPGATDVTITSLIAKFMYFCGFWAPPVATSNSVSASVPRSLSGA